MEIDIKTFKLGELEIAVGYDCSDDIKRFCEKYSLDLVEIGATDESGKKELIYFFSDGLGGYNIEAIRESL
jgi:hypothetical protein